MKKTILLLFGFLYLNSVFAQTTGEELDKAEAKIEQIEAKIKNLDAQLTQKDTLITKLQTEIEIIKEINDDLKEKYKMFQGTQTILAKKGVEIKLVNIVGNKATGNVDVEFLVYNPTKETIYFGPKDFRLVNEVGDEVFATKRKIGAHTKKVGIYFHPDTPLKMFVTFEDVVKNSKYARKINFRVHSEHESLDGMQIEWR